MKNKLGKIIFSLREQQHISGKDIARGIISVADLSRIENGEREVDLIILEALFERMGKSLDKLELALPEEEFQIIKIRIQIVTALQRAENIDKLVNVYEHSVDMGKAIHQQFVMMVKAIQDFHLCAEKQKTLERLIEARNLTLPEEMGGKVLLCNQEIQLLSMIALLQVEMCAKCNAVIENLLERLEKYVDKRYLDGEERVKIYPQCAYVYAKFLYQKKHFGKAYLIIEKGINTLSDNGSMLLARELLQLKLACAQKLENQEIVKECRVYLSALAYIYEEAGIEVPAFDISFFMNNCTLMACVNSNQMLREVREVKHISQEKLSDGICSQETLARVEAGRTPNKKKFYQIWKKLGIERERYYGLIESSDFVIYEKVREFNRIREAGRESEAMALFKEIEKSLDLSILQNKQYIERERICQKLARKEIAQEEAIIQLEELLHLTMSEISEREGIYRCPYRGEFFVINMIAKVYKLMGREESALKLYETVYKKCVDEQIGMLHQVGIGILLYINYLGVLELLNKLEEAKIIAREGLIFTINCKRVDVAASILGNLSCVYEKEKTLSNLEKCLRNSYYLLDFCKEEKNKQIVSEFYCSIFQKSIND
ncbi:MAG: helix-turn-helix transcriptional regulator [Agathobacter sp.]|nr:helix-turn-helix transcriptional regulator [Agathobacter sp.]